MSTLTTNYDLIKPASTDFVKISDINSNMDIIDTQMKANQDAAAAAELKAVVSAYTMTAAGWASSAYSFESLYPAATYDIEIQPNGDSITTAQMKAWTKAKILGSITANKAIATGTVPGVDIPVILKVVHK